MSNNTTIANLGGANGLAASGGSALVGFLQAGTGAVARTGQAKMRDTVSVEDFGVTNATSAANNVIYIQAAIDSGAARIMIPPYVVPMNGRVNLGNGQCLEGADKNKSILRKSADTIGELVYATGKTDCGIRNLTVDGVRSQTTDFVAAKWNVFFNACTRPFVDNCYLTGSLTDNLVYELCIDSVTTNVRSDNSAKGGIYWSACDGGICVGTTCDSNYSTSNGVIGALGSGFLISCTWGLSLFGIKAKNNQLGQMILSRGSKNIHVVGYTAGDRLQTRGTYGIHMIGETTSGTVHGITYDGVTRYGTEDCSFTGYSTMLNDLFDYASRIDFFAPKIDALNGTHGVTLYKCDRIRYRGGRIETVGVGVGIALVNAGAGSPTNILADSVDWKIPSTTRIFDYGTSTYIERLSLVDGVPIGIGYGVGQGGTVGQPTSKSTGVGLNKLSGTITMNAASLAANTSVGFTFSNTQIAAIDTVVVSIKSGATADSYICTVDAVGVSSCRISLRNVTGGALAEAVVLNFNVIKGSNT